MAHRVHLDYASNAPLRPESKNSMIKATEVANFDARRLYDEAIVTRYAIESCREQISTFFDCEPFEVIFTSSHSEALATFAFGVIPKVDDRFSSVAGNTYHINVIGTPYDSEIIFETWLRENIDIRLLSGNSQATLELSELANLIDDNTLALTLPFAHPDTGTLQDIEQVVSIVKKSNPDCLVHVDARLAAGNMKVSFSDLNIGAMSIDPVTFGGPSGIGALILSRKYHLSPLLTGSTQERARRAGQENYIGIAGFASACEVASQEIDSLTTQNAKFKSVVREAIQKSGAMVLNEDSNIDIDHVLSAYFPGIAASAVVAEFNRLGINIHAGSSCGSEEFEPSRQLGPVTNNDDLSEAVFRISWGWATTIEDVNAFVLALKDLSYSKQDL